MFLAWFGDLNCLTSLCEINIRRKVTHHYRIVHCFSKSLHGMLCIYTEAGTGCILKIAFLKIAVMKVAWWDLHSKSLKHATLQITNFFISIFKGFWMQISEQLFSRKPLSDSFCLYQFKKSKYILKKLVLYLPLIL